MSCFLFWAVITSHQHHLHQGSDSGNFINRIVNFINHGCIFPASYAAPEKVTWSSPPLPVCCVCTCCGEPSLSVRWMRYGFLRATDDVRFLESERTGVGGGPATEPAGQFCSPGRKNNCDSYRRRQRPGWDSVCSEAQKAALLRAGVAASHGNGE